MTTKSSKNFKLPPYLLWEYNYDCFDYNTHAIIAVTRVIKYGDLTEWQLIIDYYGINKIINLIKKTKLITPRERAFTKILLHSSFIN